MWGQAFLFHSWPGNSWYRPLGVVLNIPHGIWPWPERVGWIWSRVWQLLKQFVATRTEQTSLFAFDGVGQLIFSAIVSH